LFFKQSNSFFKRCHQLGFHVVAHAGEEGGADYVAEALDLLHVSRIDHGVRCQEDQTLVERLKTERIPLTMCPLSNLRLCVVKDLSQHNCAKLLDLGLCVTINSDDPAFFGGYLLDNFMAVTQALKLSRAQLSQLCSNSIEASFLPLEEKEKWLKIIKESK